MTPGLCSSRTFPVRTNAQVDAFTSGDVECPKWLLQSEAAILSSMSASIVAGSGTRSRASARHMSATPSSVDNPYSAKKTSIRPAFLVDRISFTKVSARSDTRCASAASKLAVSSSVLQREISLTYADAVTRVLDWPICISLPILFGNYIRSIKGKMAKFRKNIIQYD